MAQRFRPYPHRQSNRFYNNPHDRPESFFFKTLPSLVYSLIGRSKRMPLSLDPWVEKMCPVAGNSINPVVTWLGHATFLIQLGGLNILTDPLFGSPSFLFPRILPCGISPLDLPPIDIVLISHNHRDHCDLASLELIQARNQPQVLVALGDRSWLHAHGIKQVSEYNWWQHKSVEGHERGAIYLFTCHALVSAWLI